MYLTKRQKQILDYIGEYLETRGYAPTLEEIGDHFGLSSPATVYKHVQQLVRKGYLRKARHQGRGLELVDVDGERTITAPLRGRVDGGHPLQEPEATETVSLPPGFAAESPVFVVEVDGDGMADELLTDGDLLVVEERDDVRNGETVVAVVDGDRTIVGRFFRDADRVRVLSRRSDAEPLECADSQCRIEGVIVGMLRRYR